MPHYLIRIIKYYWNPLTKGVKHKPVFSKSVFLAEEPSQNLLKEVVDLLTTQLSKELGERNG